MMIVTVIRIRRIACKAWKTLTVIGALCPYHTSAQTRKFAGNAKA
jgi:hypothetical protein